MPRKRSIPDEVLLDAALVVVRTAGPDALSFAALAARTGLAPSTLVQRFGSQPALLRAALERAWDHLERATEVAVATLAPGPDGVIALLVRLSGQYASDDAYADQLLLLREDLRDPVLRARGQAWLTHLGAAIDTHLAAASPGLDGLGALALAQWQGALTVWGFTRHAPLPDAVGSALEALFAHAGVPLDRDGASLPRPGAGPDHRP